MKIINVISLAAMTLIFTSCASTKKAEMTSVSPFLGDVRAQLRPGSKTEAQLVYKNPSADLTKYNKVLLESVQFIGAQDSPLAKLSADDKKIISQYAYKAFHDELSKSYQIVASPEPGAMAIRLAVTDAQPSSVVLDTITTYIPQAHLISNLSELVTGDPPFVGRVNAEGRVTDSMNNELLLAGGDAREGAKSFSDTTNSWHDVEHTMQYFAQRFRYNLCKAQAGNECALPDDDKSLF